MPLSHEEVEYAERVLGRKLTRAELALLEAEWSEHCSYKSTRKYLSLLPTRAPWVLVGPGRDAGAVRVFEDVAVVARIESHNHPSAIDPYNGAATGVGGIIRDILSLGAEPVLLLDALYLGSLDTAYSRWLASNIVRGISDYGNRVGIPTAAGHTWFSGSYERQPLVNVACIGIARPDRILPGRVEPGDPIVLAGNTTGLDGMLGSSFASRPLSGDESDLAAVQVGNPFLEKLLIDSLLEAYREGILCHVKDLGGGGLATAVVETAAHNRVGAEVHLDRIHAREQGIDPVALIVSESQERMLLVPCDGGLEKLLGILGKYGVEYSVIGSFTGDGRVRMLYRGEVLVDLPVDLTVNPPRLRRRTEGIPGPRVEPRLEASLASALDRVLDSPRVSFKAWVYEQYDWGVGGRTILPPGYGDAAVIWLRDGTLRGIAAAVRGNPRYTRLDPFRGAALSVCEAYRRVAAVGAEPLAILDNVNSGNPEKPEQHYYTEEIFRGIAWAARGLGVPVIGGNVSLYNESEEGVMVDPVASILAIGRVQDVTRILGNRLSGDSALVLVGETRPELGGSEVVEVLTGRALGTPPEPRPGDERSLASLAVRVAGEGLASAAHSVGLGGVAVSAIKMSALSGVGLRLDLRRVCPSCSPLEAAFSESPSRILYEVPWDTVDSLLDLAREHGIPAAVVGETGGDTVVIEAAGEEVRIPVEEARRRLCSIAVRMGGGACAV